MLIHKYIASNFYYNSPIMFTRYIFVKSYFTNYILQLEYKYIFPLFLKWFIVIECIPVSLPTSFSPFLFFGKLLYRLSSREERNEVLLCFHSIYILKLYVQLFSLKKKNILTIGWMITCPFCVLIPHKNNNNYTHQSLYTIKIVALSV